MPSTEVSSNINNYLGTAYHYAAQSELDNDKTKKQDLEGGDDDFFEKRDEVDPRDEAIAKLKSANQNL